MDNNNKNTVDVQGYICLVFCKGILVNMYTPSCILVSSNTPIY